MKNLPALLAINIFWDGNPDRKEDRLYQQYVKHLYAFYNRSEANPLAINLNIPVYLFPVAPVLAMQQVRYAQHHINIIFADSALLNTADWQPFLDQVIASSSPDSPDRFFIVDVFKEGDSVRRRFKNEQVFPGHVEKEGEGVQALLVSLTHSICRHLNAQHKEVDEPINIFISHAKNDGREFARGLKERIDNIAELRSFFDEKSIAYGRRFDRQIENSIKKSVLLVLQTDQFSTREWCRREVLLAKQYGRPVLIINQLEKGEVRAFPYLGNVPYVRFSAEFNQMQHTSKSNLLFDAVLLRVMGETLRFQLAELTIKCLSEALEVKTGKALNYAPELAILPGLPAAEEMIVVYPDPPLGKIEKKLLEQLRPKLTFVTPMFLPLLSKDGKKYHDLSTLVVGLSLSEPELENQPFSWIKNDLVMDMMVDITRYLMVSGVTISFGGTLDYKVEDEGKQKYNVATLLIEMVSTYRQDYENSVVEEIKPISCYTFYQAAIKMTEQKKERLDSVAKFHPVFPPEYLKLSEEQALKLGKFDKDEVGERAFVKKYIWVKCLLEMRNKMIAAEDLRIVLGGKWLDFQSRIPGTLEEALIALKWDHPVFVLGGFGGVAAGIAEALDGKSPEQLRLAFYEKNYPQYAAFLPAYNANPLTSEAEKVDFDEILQFLHDRGKSADDFGLNNGLNEEENRRLFYSKSQLEIMCLLLKGMSQLKKKKEDTNTKQL